MLEQFQAELKWPVFGHTRQVKLIQQAIKAHNLPHGYLIYGLRGLGKKYLSRLIAASFFCTHAVRPCMICTACLAVGKKNHPGLTWLPSEQGDIGIDEIRNTIRQTRLISATADSYKLIVLDKAETMTAEAANALLKILEEPPKNTLFILLAENINYLPSTVISRCQLLKLHPLTNEEMLSWMKEQKVAEHNQQIVLNLAMGRPGRALKFLQDDLSDYHQRMASNLVLFDRSVQKRFDQLDSRLKSIKTADSAISQRNEITEDFSHDVEYCEAILRDALLFRIDPSLIINVDYQKNVSELAWRLSVEQIGNILASLNKLRKEQTEGLNLRLVWENFLLAI